MPKLHYLLALSEFPVCAEWPNSQTSRSTRGFMGVAKKFFQALFPFSLPPTPNPNRNGFMTSKRHQKWYGFEDSVYTEPILPFLLTEKTRWHCPKLHFNFPFTVFSMQVYFDFWWHLKPATMCDSIIEAWEQINWQTGRKRVKIEEK